MINRKVSSEIGVGIILIIAITMGVLFWLQDNNPYASSYDIRDKAIVEPTGSIVFLGDSITAMEDWNKIFGVEYIANAGISGNTTDDVISRLDLAIRYKPKKLFLMIGINDLFRGRDINYISKNYETIISKIRLESPETIIYLQSVLPVNNDTGKMPAVDAQKIIELNKKIKLLTDGKKIIFINLYPLFCGSDNKLYQKYSIDGVHLSGVGYAAWKRSIAEYVKNQ